MAKASSAGAPSTPRRDLTRARLLTAASAAFAQEGLDKASVESICDRAGFSRGAFYSNFASKEDVLVQVYSAHVERQMHSAVQLAAREDVRPQQIVEGFFDAWARSPEELQQLYLVQIEFMMLAIRDEQARSVWVRLQHRMFVQLDAIVAGLVARRDLRLAVPVADFVRFVVALHTGGMAQHLLEPRSVSRHGLERALLPLLMGGSSPRRNGRS